jgi:hypothetical protein
MMLDSRSSFNQKYAVTRLYHERSYMCSIVFMHLLLDVVLPASADQRLELTERDRVYPIVSKCLAIHSAFVVTGPNKMR